MKHLSSLIALLFLFAHSAFSSGAALLVIDMQKGLLDSNSSMHVQPAMIAGILKSANDNIAEAHRKNIPVVYIRNEWPNYFENMFTGNVCKKGSKNAELDSRLIIADSPTFSKSVGDAFSNKLLGKYIADSKVDTLYIEGIMAEGCVHATGKAGIAKNLKVIMLLDAIGSTSPAKKASMIERYSKEHMVVQKQL
jgi:nicotinamidase-related amidase